MDQNLKTILDFIQQNANLSAEDKSSLSSAVINVDKELSITAFKLDRTEKVKRTTAILLEETIEELEKKRKAVEAQNRELEIEAALERVRASAMSMQSSKELVELIRMINVELNKLDSNLDRSFIMLVDEPTFDSIWWMASSKEDELLRGYRVTSHGHAPYMNFLENWKVQNPSWSITLEGEEKRLWDEFIFTHTELAQLPAGIILNMTGEPIVHWSASFNKYGCVATGSYAPLTQSSFDLMIRFSRMFEQTYTRFLDLQKAEAQAREAQIEAALERVRAQAMAMHHTEDLAKTIKVYFEQLDDLINSTIVRCGAGLLNKENTIADMSTASKSPEGETYHVKGTIDMRGHPLLDNTYEHWLKQKEYSHVLRGNEIKEYYQFITNQVAIPENKGNDELYFYFPMFTEGSFYVVTNSEVPEDELQIFRRFSSVLSLTYRRFNDLQKAEAQAREAQIEAALERVRSKTMAMHNSHDVGESVATLFNELIALGVIDEHDRCGIGIMQPHELMEAWTASKTEDGKAELTIGHLIMKSHPLLRGAYKGWKDKKQTFQYILEGGDKLNYFEAIRNQADYKINRDYYSEPLRIVHTDFYFNEGCLYVFSQNEFSAELAFVFIRFASVFGQTYRRYLDLQKAEAQAIEAIKRASVDRVRAEIASMRTTTDLERITPLIWNELTTLGVPFIRSGVFIMDEEHQQMQVHLSTPDGKAIAAFRLNYEATNQSRQIVGHWREMKIFKDHMDEAAFAEYTKNLVQQGALKSDEKYVTENRPTDLYLHFLSFLQGMLYVGNIAPLKAEELQLVQNLADAFSTAYARYEDFSQLEEAKKQTEKTLSELKATQTQLIHSEKMASLGELTAGIAHEIQNPLNFVNNFSEVSKEMIEELKAERQKVKGERDEVLEEELLDDVVQNLEKINHHGKRAADIVKGMLQHSRTSSGQKEPTDINALADEYLRLAYHGLRAKDKSFNANFKTDIDPSIPNVNVVGQEIGRVLLNLINNAFYAVSQKAGQGMEGYKPVVVVQTKKRNNTMEIKVKDNGDGIPTHVLNKIFQPFFTTKPTGQGTGLGLSLSYDIVKAHGGEIKVNTKENEGTEFTIILPA